MGECSVVNRAAYIAVLSGVSPRFSEERPVRVYELEREEALGNPDLIRTQVNLVPERVRRIRIVEIQGRDTQADDGTHVANTREVGRIDITGHKSKGRQNKRIEFVLR